MKDFDYIIIGGGCAGLSLAYELEINNKIITIKASMLCPSGGFNPDIPVSYTHLTLPTKA